MSRWARPARPLAPIAVALGILGIWWVVAHNGGSGWVQALGDLVFGTLVIGILGPAFILTRARVRVVANPVDGIAGMTTDMRLEASTRLRIHPIEPPGEMVFLGPVGGRSPADDHVVVLPTRRGVHETVTLDIATAAPFALQWWTRRVVLTLPSALHVSPRRGRPGLLPLQDDDESGSSVDRAQTDFGEPRGARPYRPGDSRRQVHWRASAHSGELMVRELEGPSTEPITVQVDLPVNSDEAERVAERALGTVVRLLELGVTVLLATVEPSGPIVARVTDRRGAGRRLARAVPKPHGPRSIAAQSQ
jgi:uncharacterized protein (DUF58 family)